MRTLLRSSLTWQNGAYRLKATFARTGQSNEDHDHEFKDRAALLSFLQSILPERFDEPSPEVQP